MGEHRRQILQMLAEGKISADEAERLIAAVEEPTSARPSDSGAPAGKSRPKYLRVQVDSEEDSAHGGPTKVNVRVPMQLLRAGVKLASLLPAQALHRANHAMHDSIRTCGNAMVSSGPGHLASGGPNQHGEVGAALSWRS